MSSNKRLTMLTVSAAALAFIIIDASRESRGFFSEVFDKYSELYNIDKSLLRAIAKVESNFNPNAVNLNPDNPATAKNEGSRDIGLMQINEKTAVALGVSDNLYSPTVSIETACKLIVSLKKELGDKLSLLTLISAYNIGAPRVKRDGIINVSYTSKVYYYHTLYSLA